MLMFKKVVADDRFYQKHLLDKVKFSSGFKVVGEILVRHLDWLIFSFLLNCQKAGGGGKS